MAIDRGRRKLVTYRNCIKSAEGGKSYVPHIVTSFSFWSDSVWVPPSAPHGKSTMTWQERCHGGAAEAGVRDLVGF